MTRPTQVLLRCSEVFTYGAVTRYGRPFQVVPLTNYNPILKSYNPEKETFSVWAIPLSLAATDGIDFSFYSSSYLDVSVHWVVADIPMYSVCCGRESRDHHLCVNFPRLFADFHALLLLTPRHPPCALDRLATEIPNSSQINPARSELQTKPTVLSLDNFNRIY